MPPLLKGLLIGFSIAAPVGPIGLLCIRRSLTQGRLAGFVSGLGAATADAIYGLVAALGLTAITQALLASRSWLQLLGGIFLVYLALDTLRSRPTSRAAQDSARGPQLRAAYASTLALTLTNPMTMLSFIGIFSGLGATTATPISGIWLVSGVFLGSAAWWLLLSFAARRLSACLQPNGHRAINIVSALILAGFGFWQLAALAR